MGEVSKTTSFGQRERENARARARERENHAHLRMFMFVFKSTPSLRGRHYDIIPFKNMGLVLPGTNP